MRQQLWLSLITALKHGQCILVLGPELSASADAGPFLADQLKSDLREVGREVDQTGLAAIAQYYEDAEQLGPGALRAVAAEFYAKSPSVPGPQHRALAALPFRIVLSISHDGLLTRALYDQGKRPQVFRYNMREDKIHNPEFDASGSVARPIVYNLFGDPADPNSLVLSDNDLLDFLISMISNNPPLPYSLIAALRGRTASFLFIGFGVRQWYLRVLLKVLLRRHELSRPGNVVATELLTGLMTDVERTQTILFFQRGTRVEVEDSDIETFLLETARRLEAHGGYAGDSVLPFGRIPRVFISYASEDKATARRLFEGLRQAGLEPWLDDDALRGGTEWNRRIEEELDATDFTLVLYSPALCRKLDSYVNKELLLAEDRAMRVRGDFLIPLVDEAIDPADCIPELEKRQKMPLRPATFDADLAAVRATIVREFQRRNR